MHKEQCKKKKKKKWRWEWGRGELPESAGGGGVRGETRQGGRRHEATFLLYVKITGGWGGGRNKWGKAWRMKEGQLVPVWRIKVKRYSMGIVLRQTEQDTVEKSQPSSGIKLISQRKGLPWTAPPTPRPPNTPSTHRRPIPHLPTCSFRLFLLFLS